MKYVKKLFAYFYFCFIILIIEGVYMKRIFMFIISIIIMFTFNVSALEYNISNEEELINALSNQSTNDTINLNDNIAINNNISITGNVLFS